ncbi:hypothetical protein KNP414_02278 [Paenibacillus mucilaginosus KNP414]|uniref:Uncharacterized protein n=1 Tax=Paenibacillus mucilaginosus (strain KNP414) TaxID=1036673 RepID=F8F7T5_PAEMK|nr:hypothetical protein KNP414_02278 [Paenibacillus mucilaginosus KNP414]
MNKREPSLKDAEAVHPWAAAPHIQSVKPWVTPAASSHKTA